LSKKLAKEGDNTIFLILRPLAVWSKVSSRVDLSEGVNVKRYEMRDFGVREE